MSDEIQVEIADPVALIRLNRPEKLNALTYPMLAELVAPRRVVPLELELEAHYHGDTVLCAFGPGRRLLLAYRAGLSPASWTRLLGLFGNAVIELSDADAARYAANSFGLAAGGESVLVMPAGVSDRLLAQVHERGVTPMTVDVSEFLKKGGGSVKCMIGDLGLLPLGSENDRA